MLYPFYAFLCVLSSLTILSPTTLVMFLCLRVYFVRRCSCVLLSRYHGFSLQSNAQQILLYVNHISGKKRIYG